MSVNCKICGKKLKNSQALSGHNRFVHNINTKTSFISSKAIAENHARAVAPVYSSIVKHSPLSEQINELRIMRQQRPLEEYERLAIELETKKMRDELYSRNVETNETNINQSEIEQLKNELNNLKEDLVKEKAKRKYAKKEDLTDSDDEDDDDYYDDEDLEDEDYEEDDYDDEY